MATRRKRKTRRRTNSREKQYNNAVAVGGAGAATGVAAYGGRFASDMYKRQADYYNKYASSSKRMVKLNRADIKAARVHKGLASDTLLDIRKKFYFPARRGARDTLSSLRERARWERSTIEGATKEIKRRIRTVKDQQRKYVIGRKRATVYKTKARTLDRFIPSGVQVPKRIYKNQWTKGKLKGIDRVFRKIESGRIPRGRNFASKGLKRFVRKIIF